MNWRIKRASLMPSASAAVLFGLPDAEFGEALATAVQLSEGTTLTAEDVQAFLKSRLATFKVPKVVSFHA